MILAGTAAGILLLAGVITLLLPSNKAVENVPVGTEQTAQAGRLVAPRALCRQRWLRQRRPKH